MLNKDFILAKSTLEHTGQIPGKCFFQHIKPKYKEQLSELSNVEVVHTAFFDRNFKF